MMPHRFSRFIWVFVSIVGLLIFLMACRLAEEIRPTAPRVGTSLPIELTNTPAVGAEINQETAADTLGMLASFCP